MYRAIGGWEDYEDEIFSAFKDEDYVPKIAVLSSEEEIHNDGKLPSCIANYKDSSSSEPSVLTTNAETIPTSFIANVPDMESYEEPPVANDSAVFTTFRKCLHSSRKRRQGKVRKNSLASQLAEDHTFGRRTVKFRQERKRGINDGGANRSITNDRSL